MWLSLSFGCSTLPWPAFIFWYAFSLLPNSPTSTTATTTKISQCITLGILQHVWVFYIQFYVQLYIKCYFVFVIFLYKNNWIDSFCPDIHMVWRSLSCLYSGVWQGVAPPKIRLTTPGATPTRVRRGYCRYLAYGMMIVPSAQGHWTNLRLK